MNKEALDHAISYISSWLNYRYTQEEIPGYTVAIAHKGELVFNESYGLANVENHVKLTPRHIFRIASHSKTFTATALMQLQENGRLRIDDYAADYIPWLKEHKDARWQKVTLRQLMSHGAGVIRDGFNADYWQLERPFPGADELKKEILEAELVLDTNIKLKYSNFGYSLLGLVIEAVSGQSYQDYVNAHIIQPLGLGDTGPEYSSAIDGRLVTGYSLRDVNKTRLPIDVVDTRAMAPATGFYATAADLCTYFSAHFVGSGKLLNDESKKEMQRVHFHAYLPGDNAHEDYGLGLEINYVGGRKLISHGGGFPGHITQTMADPKDELIVVVLTNCIGGQAQEMTKGIYSILDYFKNNTSGVKPKHDLSRLEGRYLDLWTGVDIVVTGDKVIGCYPNSWQPFMQPEELEYVNDTTLKVGETNSFYSEGELVKFELEDDRVVRVNYNGTTMWPEAEWIRKQMNRKVVRLP